MLDQPGLISTHSKEVILFGDFGDLSMAIGAFPIDEVFLRPESFTGDTIPSLVVVLIDLSPFVEILKNSLDHSLVARFSGSNEVIIRDMESLPEGLKSGDHLVTMSLWFYPSLLSRLFYLLTMLIRPCKEEDLVALETFKSSKDIGSNGRIGMTDMGDIVDIVDRSSNVEGSFRFLRHGW